ncbi:MAG: patatin-like phospholipase family protein [Chitinophagaceae bacterium]|nr:patatin-like phospholipase family protein [Rubrivivax sp.]
MAIQTRKPRVPSAQGPSTKGKGRQAADSAQPATLDYCTAAKERQVVLVLQGGGALGAYQVGVYQALHEAGIEPDWVIGTSIGAINAALIAGNARELRLTRLQQFWQQVELGWPPAAALAALGLANLVPNAMTMLSGIPAFFKPNVQALRGVRAEVGVEQASYYSTEPLRETLHSLVDFEHIGNDGMRLTVGAVNANSGAMHYFDSRDRRLSVEHVMASGALPPAFPAVRIDGEPYWDGGIYSNTPIEAVLDDNPRRDSLIFAVNVWHQTGPEPSSIWEVMGRQKDIQFASRADSHIARQKQIHRLRHVIQALARELPAARQLDKQVHELCAWGCSTTVHVAHLVAPRLPGEDHAKDIDFTAQGVRARREAGYADTLGMIQRAPWTAATDPMEGVIEHR